MDAARASVDAGVRALLASAPTAGGPGSAHALCECALLVPPPRELRALRRFPVLKRRALAAWRLWVGNARSPGDAAQATRALCLVLVQSALLDEPEVTRELVESGYPAVIKAVAVETSSRGRPKSAHLPLAVRLYLATSAMQWLVAKQQEGACEADLRWIAEVAAKLAEELLEAVADSRASRKPRTAEQIHAAGKSTPQLCDYCCGVDDGRASVGSLDRQSDRWQRILQMTKGCLAEIQHFQYSSVRTETIDALVTLREALTTTSMNSPSSAATTYEIERVRARSSRKRSLNPKNITLQQYEEICKYVTSSSGSRSSSSSENTQVRCLWRLAWQKELSSHTQDNQVRLCDAILQCARSDIFAQAAIRSGLKTSPLAFSLTPSIGCQVVCRVFQSITWEDVSEILCVFSQVTDLCSSNNSKPHQRNFISSSTPSANKVVRDRCFVYLQTVLSAFDGTVASSPSMPGEQNTSMKKRNTRTLLDGLRCASYIARDTTRWMELWDLVFLSDNQCRSCYLPGSSSEGIEWFASIEDCVATVLIADKLSGDSILARDLKVYCLHVAHMLILSSGSRISSGGQNHRSLMRETTDQERLHQGMAQILKALGAQWMSGLIARISRTLVHSPEGIGADEIWLGIRTVLLPAMRMRFQAGNSTRGYAILRENQDIFVECMCTANKLLSDAELDNRYISPLVGLCCAWDELMLSQEMEAPTSPATKWGSHAVIKMNIFKNLIELYNSESSALATEKASVLMFLSETLQRATNYPPHLENDLFDLITRMTATAELLEVKTGSSDIFVESQDQEGPRSRVSHSNEVLKEVFRAASVAEPGRMKSAVKRLEQNGVLKELIHQLKRWALAIESCREASIGRETFLELAVHCSRLAYWAPAQCHGLRTMMRNVEPSIIGALKALAKTKLGRKAGLRDTAHGLLRADSSPSFALVRAEMAVRSYLRVGSLPDLWSLTSVLVKTLLKCEATSTREALLAVIQRQSSALIVECVVQTLAKALMGIGVFDTIFGDETDSKVIPALRRALTALELISSNTPICAIPTSSMIFDKAFVLLWLPYMFDAVLRSNLHPCSEAITKSLLMSLHSIALRPDSDSFKTCYWLAGMLSIAQLMLNHSKEQPHDEDSNIHEDLQNVIHAILTNAAAVSTAVKHLHTRSGDSGVNVLVLWGSLLRVGKGWIEDDKIHIFDKTRTLKQDTERKAFQQVIERLQAENMPSASVVVMQSFSQWLESALIYSQAFASKNIASISSIVKVWEIAYLDIANFVYLPLEFESNKFQLASTWLITWISSNLKRLKSESSMLQMLPFQISWFQRLIRYHATTGSREHLRSRDKVFSLIFNVLSHVIRASTDSNIDEVSQSINVTLRCLDEAQMVDLSLAVDFDALRGTSSGADLLVELSTFTTVLQESHFPPQEVARLLQYPMELAASFYVNTLGNAGRGQESSLFLQQLSRSLEEVHPASEPIIEGWVQWESETIAKYAWINRDRCLDFTRTIRGATVSKQV